jgi:ABC-2 type transport system permease protein
MKKYLSIFNISFQQEFVYRLNFVMWRVRNVIQFLLVFFLWDTIFSDPERQIFGYDRAKILTYVFGILILRALIYSSRSIDVAGEIARGDLTNYLLKPVSYFKYWFTRDLSSKGLNIIFALAEASILYLILKPPFFFQTNLLLLVMFAISLVISLILYFLLILFFSTFTFWYSEQAWGAMFLFMIFSDFLGGGIFPIDILPDAAQKIIYSLPFSYLLFVPLQIYLGKYGLLQAINGILIGSVWTIVMYFAVRNLWNKGMKVYRAEGR